MFDLDQGGEHTPFTIGSTGEYFLLLATDFKLLGNTNTNNCSSDDTGAPIDDSHVDADQMDLGDEMRKRDRPDPTGVGAALRMHWQECVKEETEKQLEAVRGTGEGDQMRWEMDYPPASIISAFCMLPGQRTVG